ncbi:MAG: XrtA-associated tyrosine autokinase [Alphaproteobacteria bacterium]|jgi:receptor protein-tyrosine kinase|nr:XrtA-associated tyrosine autokinase [Alphaproteobacteria bacterium]|tara:strand:+ start:13 stop:1014 length:1002 start_codon:yes stop_codon:yes gene_type:complete
MADDGNHIDLIQKFAEKMGSQNRPSLAERATEKMAGQATSIRTPPPFRASPPITADSAKIDSAQETAPAKAGSANGDGNGAEPAPNHIDIDLMQLQLAGMVTPMSERNRISEEYRIIKRPLLARALSRGESDIANGHLIMVTSARPEEGKTFTTINLGMSIASERELYVMLIDADVQKCSLGSRLGIEDQKGLVDLLQDDSLELSDVLIRTNIPNLTVLPAGANDAHATELLSSPRMLEFVHDISTRYPDRMIVIDAPPILASSEPGVLAQHVGQIVMVVESGQTSRAAVEKALPLIGACPEVRFVLNKARFRRGSEQFGAYSYSYGYEALKD